MTATEPMLLEVDNLHVRFPIREGWLGRVQGHIHAVRGVTFNLRRGETLGLVGESGCGKSTTGRAIMRLVDISEGRVWLTPPSQGGNPSARVDLATLSREAMRPLRRHVQMVFQDPFASLNPRMTVGDIIAEPLQVHTTLDQAARVMRVRELMDLCGLNPRFVRRYPHEFSGGQRQRIGIARALAASPSLLLCDEPISALDVSIQAQILNLLVTLQREMGLTYLFIAHDLAAVRHISDRIAVMYLGTIVELASSASIYATPLHPYSRALISAVPIPDPATEATRERIVLRGEMPSPRNPPKGCAFHGRCPYAFERCKTETPAMRVVASSHEVACHLYDASEEERRVSVGFPRSVLSGQGG